jgi:hypothetical protein
MLPKTHTFNGVKYDLMFGEMDGMCEREGPGAPNWVVAMEPDDSSRFLETVIHESLHACCYAKTEELVTRSAKDITRLLRRLGYRRAEDGKKSESS